MLKNGINGMQVLQRFFRGRRNGQEAVYAHGLSMADIRVVEHHFAQNHAKGTDGFTLGETLKVLVCNPAPDLDAGLL